MMYFEVAIEGFVECFNNFEEAKDNYEELKELGYHEAILRKNDNGERLYWNDKASAFFS